MIKLRTKYIDSLDDSKRVKVLHTTHIEGGLEKALFAIVARVGIYNIIGIRVLDSDRAFSPKEVALLAGLELPKELLRKLRCS